MPNSYEHSYQHDLDNVIDASDAVLAIGTEKVDTNTLKDRSLTGNDATIHGAMPSNGYFDGGRRFGELNSDYVSLKNDIVQSDGAYEFIIKPRIKNHDCNLCQGLSNAYSRIWHRNNILYVETDTNNEYFQVSYTMDLNKIHHLIMYRNGDTFTFYANGIKIDDVTVVGANVLTTKMIGSSAIATEFYGDIIATLIYSNGMSTAIAVNNFNTLARLPLYSHNFTQYPNSDTSLTSVFPYTSGIIISGSFNKTDGLKCTSAGTIVFSNNFEFDGSEYITLTINGIEYSGTTTVTQGTITATIVQGSNDITIEMGTNVVLEDIQIQFREVV